jgi:hypothetical protein
MQRVLVGYSRIEYAGKTSRSHAVKELAPELFYGGYDQCTIEELITLLARGLGNQEATVASAAEQGLLIIFPWNVERADWVVRAKLPFL